MAAGTLPSFTVPSGSSICGAWCVMVRKPDSLHLNVALNPVVYHGNHHVSHGNCHLGGTANVHIPKTYQFGVHFLYIPLHHHKIVVVVKPKMTVGESYPHEIPNYHPHL